MQKILKNNFHPFLSYNDYNHSDQNHSKSKYLPKYRVSWIETMLELNIIEFYTKIIKPVIAALLDTHTDPPPAKNMYFPRGATEFLRKIIFRTGALDWWKIDRFT
jgi:hypothetical protein